MNDATSRFSKLPPVLVAAGVLVYALVLGIACHAKYRLSGYSDFDLAVHAQSVWNLLHGSLESSILGIPFLGNHMVLILFLISPLYALFPSPLLLLHVQTIVLAATAFAIYLLAARVLARSWAASLALAYLIYPPLVYLNLYEFHPIALTVAFFMWMLYFFEIRKFAAFIAFMCLALSCQENVPLILIGFAIYFLIRGERGRWFWTPLISGMVYFIAVVFVVMPKLNGAIQFGRLYEHLGPTVPEAMGNVARHPFLTLAAVFSAGKLVFLNALFGPVGYLSMLSPLSLIPAAPAFAQRLLSARIAESTVAYHYQAEFIPFIFFAAIHGMRRLRDLHRLGPAAALALILIFPLSSFVTCEIPLLLFSQIKQPEDRIAVAARMEAALSHVPPLAPVLATFEALPKLVNRPNLYSFHHVYSGCYTLSDVPYPTPYFEYVVMDTSDLLTFGSDGFYGPENHERIRSIVDSDDWSVAYHENSTLVFRKSPGSGPPGLVSFHDSLPAGIIPASTMHSQTNCSIRLAGFTAGGRGKDGTVPVTLYWEKPAASDMDYRMVLLARSPGKEMLYSGVLAPGSVIWSPQSWPAAKYVADRHNLRLTGNTADIKGMEISVTVRTVEATSGQESFRFQ